MLRYFIAGHMSLLIVGVIVGCNMESKPLVTSTAVTFPRSVVASRDLSISNPRKVGKHHFKTQDGVASIRQGPTDVEVWNYFVEFYLLVKISDGTKLAVHDKRGARFGALGQVDTTWDTFEPQNVTSVGSPSFDLPIHDAIEEFVFIIRSASEETGWRVAIIEKSAVLDDTTVNIPDLLTLPRLDEDVELGSLVKKSLAEYDTRLDN